MQAARSLIASQRWTLPLGRGDTPMQTAHITVLATLQRVRGFMDTNADALGEINTSGYRHILNDVVDALEANALTQSTSKKTTSAEAAKRRVLRNALEINVMRP